MFFTEYLKKGGNDLRVKWEILFRDNLWKPITQKSLSSHYHDDTIPQCSNNV